MEKTLNVISTPNIEGNIGSCKLSSDTIQTKGGMLMKEYATTQVNSCTGKVVNTSVYLDYTGVWGLIVCSIIVLVFTAIGIMAMNDSDY